jgi:hypothetical protein
MTAFLDGKTAYVTKEADNAPGYVVVVVNSEDLGYSEDDRFTTVYASEDDAQKLANRLNRRLGVSALEAQAIKTCSMFPGARYTDVLESLSRR